MFILLSENLFVVLSLGESVLFLTTAFTPCLTRACRKELFQSRYTVLTPLNAALEYTARFRVEILINAALE